MNKKNIVDFYPLSPMQQGMWFHSLAAPESGVYVEQMSCTLVGDLDTAAFQRAWEQIIVRHPVLRTGVIGVELKEPVQVVQRQVGLPLAQQDWRGLSLTEQASWLQTFLARERRQGFDLSQPPLMRLALLRTADNEHRFVWTYHHILLDGWSLPILLGELFSLYEALRQGHILDLPARRPYRDYIAWLRTQDMDQARSFWQHTLAGFTTPVPLVIDRPIPDSDRQPCYKELEIQLPEDTTAVLQSLARQHQLTLNTFVQGAWALLLHRYSGVDDILFGATVSGRPPSLAGSEEMVGLFINTLPVRLRIPTGETVLDWLKSVQAQQVELRRYEYSPLVEIQRWSEVPRDLPLFESILVFENYPMETAVATAAGSLTLSDIASAEQTNYPLTLVAGVAETLHLRLLYDDGRFTAGAIQRMLGHLRTLLAGMATVPEGPLVDLPLLTPAEEEQLLLMWNDTAVAQPTDRCVHELVADMARQEPNATAIVFGEITLSYAELNGRANQIAHFLQKQGVGLETIVGICLPRCPEMIVIALAALKAGGAYLPLDTTYPAERLAFMLEDASPMVLFTQEEMVASGKLRGADDHSQLIILNDDWATIARESAENLAIPVNPENLAYVIYTSGSTGRPKGVQVPHQGLSNLVHWHQHAFSITPNDRATQVAAPGFDAAVWEIWPYLTAGAGVYIPDEITKADPTQLRDWLVEQNVTITFLPTPLAESVLCLTWPPHTVLRLLLTGGDQLHHHPPPDLPFTLVNNYGPTEVSVVTTSGVTPPVVQSDAPPSLGRPIDNTALYVLDQQLRPVPVGVPGELYVGGAGVARGYLRRPALTAERFVPLAVFSNRYSVIGKPFTDNCSPFTVYRSGDLVRYRSDGDLEFLGRIDQQVKIRGFRVELGEIEAALRQDEVVETAVVATDDTSGEKRLVAYVVPADNGAGYDEAALRRRLQRTLPPYMVPALFVTLDALPLTPNGKVDRRALPTADGGRPDQYGRFIPPRDTIEAKITQIWETVLNVRPVGVTDNFFELGGHSLLAVRLIAQIQQQFGQTVTLTDLFRGGTVEHLAALLRQQVQNDDDLALIPLIPGQAEKRPLFFIHPSGGSVHWYTGLASHLDAKRPFIGIQARGIRGEMPLHTNIPDMAAAYVQAVRTRQPSGPYLLGSWSLGVIIAYEMARQLETQGETVALLALLDQGPHLPHDEPEDTAAYLLDTFGKHVPLSLATLRELDEAAQIAHVFAEARRVGWILPDVTLLQFSHFVRILRTHTDAWRQYPLRAYGGHVTLFRAAEQADETLSRDMGWATLAAGGVTIVDVPGDHLSMMHEPHVAALAQALATQVATAVGRPAAVLEVM